MWQPGVNTSLAALPRFRTLPRRPDTALLQVCIYRLEGNAWTSSSTC